MKVSFLLEDARVPRTIYYQRLREALAASPRFVVDPALADLVFPAEDTALETNWPRFGVQASAFIRGHLSEALAADYTDRVIAAGRPTCVVNMHPFVRVPRRLADHARVIVADVNLLGWERAANPRTISMPALPITVGRPPAGPRTVLASFRGALSHPCRAALARLHDGRDFVCELVASRNHIRRVDATSGRVDRAYTDLLGASLFAFVPRGDAHFSYRLLEVMSFGCIPIVISDDWVLPFDRIIDWDACAVRVSEQAIARVPEILAGFSANRIERMQRAVTATWHGRLGTLDRIVEALLDEVEVIRARAANEADEAGAHAHPAEAERMAAYRERVSARAAAPVRRRSGPVGAVLREFHDWLGRKLR